MHVRNSAQQILVQCAKLVEISQTIQVVALESCHKGGSAPLTGIWLWMK